MKLPQTADSWKEADEHMKQVVVPNVLQETDVNVMNHVLCYGIYSYFTTKCGTQQPNRHNQHQTKVLKKSNELKEALIEKNVAKKNLRQMRRTGSNPETIRKLACEFHRLVRAHSRLNKTVNRLKRLGTQKQRRKDCRNNPYKFARKILNDENYTSIEPTFDKHNAEDYFTEVCSSVPKTFTKPSWMPEAPAPSVPMDTAAFTVEEVTLVLSRSKPASCPSSLDQIPYLVLKKSPSLMSALLHLFNTCWAVKLGASSLESWGVEASGEKEG